MKHAPGTAGDVAQRLTSDQRVEHCEKMQAAMALLEEARELIRTLPEVEPLKVAMAISMHVDQLQKAVRELSVTKKWM